MSVRFKIVRTRDGKEDSIRMWFTDLESVRGCLRELGCTTQEDKGIDVEEQNSWGAARCSSSLVLRDRRIGPTSLLGLTPENLL